jgi:hypothetical protein
MTHLPEARIDELIVEGPGGDKICHLAMAEEPQAPPSIRLGAETGEHDDGLSFCPRGRVCSAPLTA